MPNSSDLKNKITLVRKTSNSLMTDQPVFTSLFTVYAKLTYGGNSSFDSAKGTDIIKVTLSVIVRDTKLFNDIDLNNLFVLVKGKYFKVTSTPVEAEDGYLKFDAVEEY